MSAPAQLSPQFETPLGRFAAIVEALCRAMAADAHARGLAGPLAVLIFTRLRRLAARFAATVARGPAAQRAQPATSRTRSPSRRPDPPACLSRCLPPRLPRRFAWLRTLLPATAGGASQLSHLLADPEMTALIAANPATGRALRPLCHLLGIRPPPALRRPPRAKPQAATPPGPQPTPHPTAVPKPRPLPRPGAVPAPGPTRIRT